MKTMMTQAIYEDGVFRPLQKIALESKKKVSLVIVITEEEEKKDDLPLSALAEAASQGGSFDFLYDESEDIYTLEDGEPIWE
ncbi:antitoxin family protein [bacterium]|nr:antitoxin family protein [bacterium]